MRSEDLASDRVKLNRLPDRGHYDREAVNAVLDAGRICHVSFIEDGRPMCLPTAYGRNGDDLILHGAAKGRLLEAMGDGRELCINVTLLDGLVLARSTFHSSMNYRSVVLLGRGEVIEDDAERGSALDVLVDHLAPGRAAEVRASTEQELGATSVIRVPIVEASAKVRTGPPIEAKSDLESSTWGGVVPMVMRTLEPIPGEGSEQLEVPPSVSEFEWK